jgi:Tn7-like transposition protein D/TniQ
VIGYFPLPYDDETLYSLCARYADRMDISSAETVRIHLFGDKRKNSETFPGRLSYLASQFPLSMELTEDNLIDKHTAVPFVSPFLSTDTRARLVAGMKGEGVECVGSMQFGARSTISRLRYCPLCANQNRQEFGETYWHRLHQIDCVRVCPLHKVHLEETPVYKGQRTRYELAETQVPASLEGRKIEEGDPYHMLLLWLSEQSSYLLSRPRMNIDRINLIAFYRFHLTQNGYERPGATKGLVSYARQLSGTYEHSWMYQLGLEATIKSNRSKWLSNTILRGKGSTLQHLLLMRCLGLSVMDLESAIEPPLYFEPGPWPCLNPICENINRDVIETFELTYLSRVTPIGFFRCHCGFEYSRRGPDQDGSTRTHPYRILTMGNAWDEALRSMWHDPAQNIERIASFLGVSRYVIMTSAIRLGLPFGGIRQMPGKVARRVALPKKDPKSRHRARVLRAVSEHPDMTRTELIKIIDYTLCWLRRNDSAWLEAHLPPRRKPHSDDGSLQLGWKERDMHLASRIPEIRKKLMHVNGTPVRVSYSRILRELGFPHGVFRRRCRPKTSTAVSNAVESHQAFALRRLLWEARQESGQTVNAILRRASVRPEWRESAMFSQAIAQVKDMLVTRQENCA